MTFLHQKLKTVGALLATAFSVVACSKINPPVQQIHSLQTVNNTAEQQPSVKKRVEAGQAITQYFCRNDKRVTVQYRKATVKSKKKNTVIVTFGGASHQLSQAVTKDGKKFTNIRWTWHEKRNGTAFLYNNTKKTLAADCVKQP